jgi:hypothetical protein
MPTPQFSKPHPTTILLGRQLYEMFNFAPLLIASGYRGAGHREKWCYRTTKGKLGNPNEPMTGIEAAQVEEKRVPK